MMGVKCNLFALSLSVLLVSVASVDIFLIRHGEKINDDLPGLSEAGKQRALCLVSGEREFVFASILCISHSSRPFSLAQYLGKTTHEASLRLDTFSHSGQTHSKQAHALWTP